MTQNDTKIIRSTVNRDGYDIPVRIYIPACASEHEQLPVLYYIHGGGFFAGSPDVVEEAVKFYCETFPCVAVSVDYRLAPENPYPAGHEDCYEVLKWTSDNIHQYHGDANKIFVAGDSAGGNLTAYCAMRDKEDEAHRIKAQILYYPTVNMAGTTDEYFEPGRKNYSFQKKYESVVLGMTEMMGSMGGSLAGLLGEKADSSHKYLSPYMADLRGQAPALILVGEYDFLYPECVGYAKKLALANVPVKSIIYKGMTHAFLDNMGTAPQAEDSVLEVIKFVKEVINL